MRLFDTADSYGSGAGFDGRSEILLGEFLKACPSDKARDVILATKLAPFPWRVTSGSFVKAARDWERFRRIGFRWGSCAGPVFGNYQPLQEGAVGGHRDACDEGVIGAVGLSNYGPKQLR